MIDFDANATSAPLPEVIEAVAEAMRQDWGHPGSRHGRGRRAHAALEKARAGVAALVAVPPRGVIFTSGATEANRLGVELGLALAAQTGRRVAVVSPTVHPSLANPLRALAATGRIELRWAAVGPRGVLDLPALEAALGPEVALLAAEAANGETGVVQPVGALAALARAAGAHVHIDAAQFAGRVAIEEPLPADTVAVSAHKLHGPSGVGALLVREGVSVAPIQQGGSAERGVRPGTENVAGAAGFAVAAREAARALAAGEGERVRLLRDRLEEGLVRLGAIVHGAGAPRLPNTSSVRFDGLCGATILLELSKEKVMVSTGSACLSRDLRPSPVLTAMGLRSEDALGAVRFSLHRFLQDADIDCALEATCSVLRRLRLVSGSPIP
ncbi:MAG: cysteine desulfurase family protein [Planctomycetota bacterium]|jgi:cysteine desulfurase